MKRVLIIAMMLTACSSRPGRPHFWGKDGSQYDSAGDSQAAGPDASLHIVDSRSNLRMNSVEVLINKLKFVAGLDEKADAIELARKSFALLGGYDYSQGILPENLWNPDKMSAWYKVVDTVCQDSKLVARLQKSGGEKEFLEAAYGRDQTADEANLLTGLKATGAHRARIVCSIVLSSGEFVSL